jgi:hypothetical protein
MSEVIYDHREVMADHETTPNTPRKPRRKRYSCPYCGSTEPPVEKSTLSNIGFLFFLIMVLFCITLPLSPLCLLARDKWQECPDCQTKLN